MKKYIYILGAALLAFACSQEQPYEPELMDLDPEDGPKVTVEFSLPPATKGTMAHDPEISTIHVAVFNKAGILKQFEEAVLTQPENVVNGENPSGNPRYSVELTMSATKRILHFIADSPVTSIEELAALGGTSGEAAVLNAITTSGTDCAYWQRVELDKVDAYTYQGGEYRTPDGGVYGSAGATSYVDVNGVTVNKGDYIKRDGTKILDGTGYFQSQAVADKVASIALVRNFAEITVVANTTTSNFTPRKFALLNVPKAGYVAPYDTDKSEFVSAYLNPPASGGLTHSDVKASGYSGTMVGNVNSELPTTFIDLTGADDSKKKAYMYERPVPTIRQPATCIIVGGDYDDPGAVTGTDGLTWFKIEITDEEGDYFPFYRGVSYLFKIGSISGSRGYMSPEEAYDAPAIGDVSNSVETASLEQINDGKGTTLWVEYTDHVATSGGTKTLYYTMYYQATAGGTISYLNDGLSLSVSHPDENYKAILDQTVTGVEYTGTGDQAGLPTPPSTDREWMVATVNLDGIGDRTKYSILHVEGASHAGKKMSRDVNYRVMGTQEFKNGSHELSATSLENENAGQQTTLTIYLPNDLGMSMFPLVLRIEAQNGNYTTVDGLPVESGPSLFGGGKNAFYFLKTINYTDYYNAVTGLTTTKFQTKFKTTRDGTTSAAGTNATDFRVLDKVQTERDRTEPYFKYAECSVTVGGPVFKLVETAVQVNSNVTTATLQLRSTSSGTWTLTPSANVTSLSQTTGTGNAEVTITIPENTDENAAKTYTVTARLDETAAASIPGYAEQVFTITQKKKTNKYYTVNLNVDSYPWVESSLNPDAVLYESYESGNKGITSSTSTMSITITGYTSFKFYVLSNGENNYDYIAVYALDDASHYSAEWNYGRNRDYDYVNTRGKSLQQNTISTVNINNYTEVSFTNISEGEHTIYIQYGKDSITDSYTDTGYVLIPVEQ